jgi:hemerythrin
MPQAAAFAESESTHMQWKDEYSVGIKEIDAQHKELVSHFCRIDEAIDANHDWSEIHLLIIELRNFASFHFEFEEAMMRLFGYSELKSHAEAHVEFFAKLSVIEKSTIIEEIKSETVSLLFDWLFSHIISTDQAFATYVLKGAHVIKS